jgi:hypothetical protein
LLSFQKELLEYDDAFIYLTTSCLQNQAAHAHLHFSNCIGKMTACAKRIFGRSRLCLKARSGFERLIFRLTASGSIDDKTNIACFSSLGVARDRLCQAKKRSISHPTTEFSDRA